MTPLDPMLQKELALWQRSFALMPNPANAERLALTLLEIFIMGLKDARIRRQQA